MALWLLAGVRGAGLDFSLLENFLQKVHNLWLKMLILGVYWGKNEIVSTHNLVCRKFAAVCRKIATFCPLNLFNPRHRCCCNTKFRLSISDKGSLV